MVFSKDVLDNWATVNWANSLSFIWQGSVNSLSVMTNQFLPGSWPANMPLYQLLLPSYFMTDVILDSQEEMLVPNAAILYESWNNEKWAIFNNTSFKTANYLFRLVNSPNYILASTAHFISPPLPFVQNEQLKQTIIKKMKLRQSYENTQNKTRYNNCNIFI